ncbi:MAG: glycosyltransferase [Pseudomonadota bacterium]
MRLLQIIADGRPGGGTTQVLALLKDLKGMGEDLHFVCQNDSYALDEARGMGISVSGMDFFRSRLDPGVTIKLHRLTRSYEPDVVHLHGGRAGFFAGMMPSNRKRTPVIYTVHGYHFLRKPWGIRHLAALAERRISGWADITTFVCHYDRCLAREWRILPADERGTVVYNGVNLEDIPQKSHTDPTSIGFFGRLTYQKDPLLFLEIVRILAAEGYIAKIVGGGDMERDVRRAIEQHGLTDCVKLCGPLPRGEALKEIADSAVVVFPSRWEGLPLAPLELMYMGIPLVAADVSGIPEIIENEVSGVLIKERDPRRYVPAIRKLAEDSGYRERLVNNARRTVAGKFIQQRTTEHYLRLYDRLCSRISR